MKIGVLSNPLSRRNRRHLPVIEAAIRSLPDVAHERLAEFGELPSALERLANENVEVLIINGGDGTVSATMTGILENGPFADMPRFAILPGGTSNTIAASVGLRGKSADALVRFVDCLRRQPADCETLSQPLMRVRYDPEQPAVYGMFFGTAAICDAIALRRRLFPQPWLPDAVAAAATLVVVLANAAVGRRGVLSGRRIAVTLGNTVSPAREYAIVIATTLEKIVLGGAPFWGGDGGAVKITSIASPPRGLVRNAFRLLYGRDRGKLPADTYRSGTADHIELGMDCPFNLDGEFYQPAPGGGVVVSATEPVTFLRCRA